jgi:hypothetical protein
MSKLIMKILILFFYSLTLLYGQESPPLYVCLDLKDKLVENYKINKDSSALSLKLYINGYELKENRNNFIRLFRHLQKKNELGMVFINGVRIINPSSIFTLTLYNLNKPEKILNRNDINYVTVEEFCRNLSKPSNPTRLTNPTYIIYKLKDSTYLKWEVITIPEE